MDINQIAFGWDFEFILPSNKDPAIHFGGLKNTFQEKMVIPRVDLSSAADGRSEWKFMGPKIGN